MSPLDQASAAEAVGDRVPGAAATTRTVPGGSRLRALAADRRLGPVTRRARRLLRSGRGGAMRPPGKRHYYRALAVADVDLDTSTVTLREPFTPYATPPQGVHALVWFHGHPVGEVTVPGDPQTLSTTLLAEAARAVRPRVLDHLLQDALATPGGVAAATRSRRSPEHPSAPVVDGSDITIAICTRDRPEDLRRCLSAIQQLTTPAAAVLVVDNASVDDRTRELADEFGVGYVREPRAGLDWARNRALLEARTPIVAFTDDDVVVQPGWVAGIARAFAEEPDAAAVTGLVAPAELATPAQVFFEAQGGFGRGYVRKYMSVAVELGDVAARFYPGTGGAGTGANMAVVRDVALALGGFDPALDVGTITGGGGDLEMYFRIIASGRLLVYEPSAVVRHVHRRDLPGLVRQMRGNGTGSYSIFVGAGRRYGRVQNREFLLFGLRWLATHHVRAHRRGLVWPRSLPWALARAESAGMVAAVLGRYYARARARAAQESAHHPTEPRAPELRHRQASRRSPRRADPVIDLDLLGDEIAGSEPPIPVERSRQARRVRVRVTRDGRAQATFPVWTGGSQPSMARLRAEAVSWLGPAVLVPGVSWDDLLDQPAGTAPQALERMLAAPGEPPATRPSVSVLMATRDRPGQLRRCLRRLVEVTAGDVQVVVVDNSPDPSATVAALREFPDVVVLHEPRPGLSRARNAGTGHLTGDVVVLLDDDVVITPGWLDELLAPFADPSVTAVTGNVLPADLDSLESQLFEDYGGLGRGAQRRAFDPAWLRAGSAAPTWDIGATANAAIRREALDRLGPWDEALGAGRPAGVGEDTEYFYRVLQAGGRIVYQPTAVVLHHHRSERAALRRQLQAYSAGHVAYHLQILARYGDARGLRRIAVRLPRYYLSRAWRVVRGRDDFPGDLLRAEILGSLRGVPAWLVSRRTGS